MEERSSSLFANRDFLKLWIGQAISFVGDAVSMVALVVLVVRITGSASAVGGVLVARILPTLASPLVGVLADRFNRRAILVASDLARAALLIGILFTRDLPTLYVLAFLMGAAQTFFNPTIRAAFPSVVADGDLTRANAIISGTFSFSITVGPAVGGLIVASTGINTAFLLDALSFLISAIFLALIALPLPEREEEEGFVQELRAGLGYFAGARIPLAIMIGTFLAVLAENTTIPAEVFLAKQTFDAGDMGYGLLVAAWGGGMVLGSLLMGAVGDRANMLPFYFSSIFISALALVGAGVSPTFVLALGALIIAGASNGVDNVTTNVILQKQVPDAFLGRVFSVRFLSFSSAEALAYAGGGLIMDAVGPRATYLLAGAGVAVAGLLILIIIATTHSKAA